jgi:cyclin-dependent kinase 9
MPCDLSKMLSQHTQSMFEYLAPPRRTGQMLRYQQQMGVNPMQPKPQDNSYQDRVY